MSIPGSANPLLLKSAASSQYLVERSLRFSSSDSAYLSRTPASAGNRKTWTWAGWVKLGKLGSTQRVFKAADTYLSYYSTTGTLYTNLRSAATNYFISYANVYRDPSAWYHIVLAVDTTQATAANRQKLYVNGVQVTASGPLGQNYPPQNEDTGVNSTSNQHQIAGDTVDSLYFDGYLADVHFIDGQALTPSSFTEVSATTGQLIPKAYSGPTPTGNSFWLPFSDNSAATATTLGKDGFLLGNNWNPVNVSVANGAPASVASASGALPIYNTTDTYGGSLGSGVRSDPNASYLVLAVPMNGSNGGTSFSDQLPSGRTSSLKTFTNTGTTTSTSQSKYYGSSGYFNGSSFLQIPSSSDFYLNGAFTVEVWCYPTLNVSSPVFFVGNWNNNEGTWLGYSSTGTPYWSVNASGTGTVSSSTALRYNSWNHLAFVSTGTGGRNSIYLNGALVGSAPHGAPINNTSNVVIGAYVDSNYQPGPRTPMTGYLQDLRVYKGIAKYTTDFNPPSATANPTAAAGFDTPVDTPSSAGTDTGLGGQVTGNYCTWNPLDAHSSLTITNGNLDLSNTAGTTRNVRGTIGFPSSGKWYYEVTPGGSVQGAIGIGSSAVPFNAQNAASSVTYFEDGSKGVDASRTAYGSSYASGDVIGIAFNADTNQVTFYKNGVSQGALSTTAGVQYFPFIVTFNATYSANFGQRTFAYPVSGFKCLCDTSLPLPVVAKSSDYFQTVLYTGNGSTQTISGLGFSPDLIWTKSRSRIDNNVLHDIVRGRTSNLYSDLAASENTTTTSTADLVSFDANGYTLGTVQQSAMNRSGETYVAWAWDAGTTTSSNGSGSITSQVRANPSAGFSIVTWTANTTTATVGHGLNVAPSLVIMKDRDSAIEWMVYNEVIGQGKYLALNNTSSVTTASTIFNPAPTSTVFSPGSLIKSSNGYGKLVAYCFAPVAGYSSMGSYVGNGSSDGVFQWCGFRPRWILIKASSAAGAWILHDTARSTYNVMGNELRADLSDAEYQVDRFDLLSNGFKVRSSNSTLNASSVTYIYFAVAESPFAYSRAR